ncbi:hypothetical protein PM082_004039 [Marasmius tenuissimus]|nr:hypothetical protein PM082_004039 [Marasmius tenuissimus]
MLDVSPTTAARLIPTFTEPELHAMITTAHSYGVKIAAHANTLSSFKTLLSLGIDSIEHCIQDHNPRTLTNSDSNLSPINDLFSTWSRNHPNTFWVPTLAVYYKFKQYRGGNDPKANADWDRTAEMFKRALELGFERITCGGDTGAFTHGENALEMKLMVELGADPKKVLRWATLSGWECLRGMHWETTTTSSSSTVVGDNDVRFGCIKKGWAADIVALDSDDVESEFEHAVDRVTFVMKGGRIYKEGAS